MINWFKQRQDYSKQQQYDAGFGWVMARYWVHKEPTYYITDCLHLGSTPRAFIDGGSAALDLLPDPNEEWNSQQ